MFTKNGKDDDQKQQKEYHIEYGCEHLKDLFHHPVEV